MTPSGHRSPLPIAVLLSGTGRTLRNLIEHQQRGALDVEIRLVISSRPAVGGLEIARSAGIPALTVAREASSSASEFSEAIFGPCRDAGAQLVAMGGYMSHVPIPPEFENRVMNVHPALIPAFCGQGFYGERVHRAVLEYGAKVSGCTIHFADNLYDHGPIILQHTVPVRDDDTPANLAARVFEQECCAYPQAIQLFAEDRLRVEGRRVRILP